MTVCAQQDVQLDKAHEPARWNLVNVCRDSLGSSGTLRRGPRALRMLYRRRFEASPGGPDAHLKRASDLSPTALVGGAPEMSNQERLEAGSEASTPPGRARPASRTGDHHQNRTDAASLGVEPSPLHFRQPDSKAVTGCSLNLPGRLPEHR